MGNDRYGHEIIVEKVDLPQAARSRPRVKPRVGRPRGQGPVLRIGVSPRARRGNPSGSLYLASWRRWLRPVEATNSANIWKK